MRKRAHAVARARAPGGRDGPPGGAPPGAAPPGGPGPPRPWYDPRSPFLAPLAIALAARLDFAHRLHHAAEDAYITFRYAENWAHGLGPVYNPGQHVMGFSSPLWTAWLAAGAALGVPLLTWARAWGTAFDLAALLLMVTLLAREASRASAWAFGLFFAVFPLFSANAVLGMETSLLVFLVAVAAWARSRGTGALCGVALGLLGLTRPEGCAVALAAVPFVPVRARWIFGGLLVAGLGALTLYYGSPIPQSVTAKALSYGVGAHGLAFAWVEGLVPGFFARRWQELLEAQHLFAVSVITLPAAVVGLVALWRERRAAFLVAAGGLAVLVGYCALGVPYFGWYYVLPLFGWGTAAAAGLPRVVRSRLVWAALALYIGTDAPYLSVLYQGRNEAEARVFGAAADALRAASGGRGTLLVEPIGRIGDETRMTVIDEVGLVSPQVSRRRAAGPGWYADLLRQARPDFIAVRTDVLQANRALGGRMAPFRSANERDSALAAYEPIGPSPTSRDALLLFKRRGTVFRETAP